MLLCETHFGEEQDYSALGMFSFLLMLNLFLSHNGKCWDFLMISRGWRVDHESA